MAECLAVYGACQDYRECLMNADKHFYASFAIHMYNITNVMYGTSMDNCGSSCK